MQIAQPRECAGWAASNASVPAGGLGITCGNLTNDWFSAIKFIAK
jgi:hypothetical protein